MLSREPDEDLANWIHITNLCEALHCLPKPGGLLDQDPDHIRWMTAILVAKAEKQELEAEKAKQQANERR